MGERISKAYGHLHENGVFPALFYTCQRVTPINISTGSGEPDAKEVEDLYEVRIIDNDYNTYLEVIEITMLALGIREDQAFAIAWEVDHSGSCVVAQANRSEAEEIAGLIRTIGIVVQVNPINEARC